MFDVEDTTLEEQVRVATPAEVSYLVNEAIKRKFNRQIKREVVDQLEGYSFIIPVMIHEHRQGLPTEPHWRCRTLLRFSDDPNLPHEGWIDVDMEDLKKLRTVKQLREDSK